MIKVLLTSIVFLFYSSTFSQSINNSDLKSNCIGNGFIAPTCVKGWYASGGYPMILGDLKSNTWAMLTSSGNKTEGIFTNYNFIQGKTYTVSFRIKTGTNNEGSSANIKATSGFSYSSYDKANSVSQNTELIWSTKISKKTSEWETVNIKFTATKNNTQLWIYPSLTANSAINNYSQIEIDDIKINSGDKNASVANNSKKIEEAKANSNNKSEYIFPEIITKGDYLNIRVNTQSVSQIQIIDLAGNVFNTNFIILNSNYIKLHLNSKLIQEGSYIVKIIKKDNSITTKKLTVT